MGKRKIRKPGFIIIDKRVDDYYYAYDRESCEAFINDRKRNSKDFKIHVVDQENLSVEERYEFEYREIIPSFYDENRYITHDEADALAQNDGWTVCYQCLKNLEYILKDYRMVKFNKRDKEQFLYGLYILSKRFREGIDKGFRYDYYGEEMGEDEEIPIEHFFNTDILEDIIIEENTGRRGD